MKVLTEPYRNPDPPLVFGAVAIDLARREVRGPAGVQRLEPRVAQLLALLIERRGAVVSREALIDALSAGAAGSDEALSQTVARLRRVLGDDPRAPRFILTAPRVGYRWIAEGDAGAPRRPRLAELTARYPRLMAASLAMVLVTGMIGAAGMTWLARPAPPRRMELKQIRITHIGGKTVTTTRTASGPNLTLDP